MMLRACLRHRRHLSTASTVSPPAALERFRDVANFKHYPHFFPIIMSLREYQHKFKTLEPKARCPNVAVALAGRVVAIRHASKNLVLSITKRWPYVQVLSEVKHFQGSKDEGGEDTERFPGKSGKGELSIIPKQLEVLAPCIQPFPNSKYGIKEPVSYNVEIRATDFHTRAKVIQGIRRYLEDRDFIEVETPMLYAAAGGAAAQPFLFLKQLVIGGFDRVFEIGKVFRNEGIDATHNPEFTMYDFEYCQRCDGSFKIQYPLDEVNEGACNAIVEIDFTPPFKRLSILETLEDCIGEKLPDVNSSDSIPALLELCKRHNVECAKPHTCTRLMDKLIGHFIEPKCINPTFLYDHPTCMSPLAKAHRNKENVTERFELFVAGKELCNAYTELNDPSDQRQRFAAQQVDQQRGDNEAHQKDDEFCTALEYGLPPTGGFGIGVDRLVMLLSGKLHIREVILFPAMKPKLDIPYSDRMPKAAP
ncbi:putative aminoacyl-tRNA synthetase, class II, nucleic acid-binding protein [Plasmopara halstedii]